MKELVEVIAKALVDHPDEVSVNEKKEGRTTVLELHVADGDMGKVIGKQGRIAKAIRSVVKAERQKKIKELLWTLYSNSSAMRGAGAGACLHAQASGAAHEGERKNMSKTAAEP